MSSPSRALGELTATRASVHSHRTTHPETK